MTAPLQRLFVGELADHHDALALHDDPRPGVRADRLVEPETLDPLLRRLRPGFTAPMRRGVVSQWSKYYLARLIPAATIASLALDWCLPLAPDRVEVVLDEAGKAVTFKLPHVGSPLDQPPTTAFERFADLLDEHLEPQIEALAAQSRLAPRVLWSNAGNVLEFLCNRLAETDPPPVGVADLHALLETRLRPDGRRNPLYQSIHYVEVADEQGRVHQARRRRVCCIRDLVPEHDLCATCPRLRD